MSTTRIHLSQFADERLPLEYRDVVRSAGQVEGAFLLISTDRLNTLKHQYGRPLPPIATQLTNAASAARRVISAAVSGQPIRAAEEEIQRRKETCATCLELRNARCTQCGCYYQAKIQLATEHCPLGKW